MQLEINGQRFTIPQAWRDGTLLEVLRDLLGLTGTKFGCGKGFCGACTVHVDGSAARACQLPLPAVEGRSLTTIEGLGDENQLDPLQQAWIEESVPQCGYCQAGQLMTASAFLHRNPNPTPPEIRAAMSGNLCRCGTYPRIQRAIEKVVQERGAGD